MANVPPLVPDNPEDLNRKDLFALAPENPCEAATSLFAPEGEQVALLKGVGPTSDGHRRRNFFDKGQKDLIPRRKVPTAL
jgi:hypothetical protein